MMDWCSQSNPCKKFKLDNAQVNMESLLSIFIEYYWDERDGQPTGNEDIELMHWIESMNFDVNTRFWLSPDALNLRDRARIQLTDEISGNEHLLREAEETNRGIKYAQLLYNLKAVIINLINGKGDANHSDKYYRTLFHDILSAFVDVTELPSQDRLSRFENLMKKLIPRAESSLYITDISGNCPFRKAAYSYDKEILRIMTRCYLAYMNCSVDANTVFHWILQVVSTNKVPTSIVETTTDKLVLRILASCLNNRIYTPDTNSALHHILYDFNYEYEDNYLYVIRIIVSNRPHFMHLNKNGIAAIHIASEKLLLEVIKIFVRLGDDVRQLNLTRETSLHLACKSPLLLHEKAKFLETIDFLLSRGCTFDDTDVHGFTPMHSFVQMAFLENVFSPDQLAKVPIFTKQLMERGASLFASNKRAKSPFSIAAKLKNERILELLMPAVTDMNEADDDGNTPLHIVIDHCVDEQLAEHKVSHTDIVRHLVSRAADLNKANNLGITAVHMAAAKYQAEVLKILADNAADFKVRNRDGKTALHAACQSLVKLRDTSAILQSVDILISQGCDLEAVDGYGYMPLHYAAENGNVQMVEKLIALGAKVDCLTEKLFITPLYLASQKGHLHVMKKLVEAGANVNAKAATDISPMMICASKGSLEAARYLLEKGADLHQRHKTIGFTALHFAAYGHMLDKDEQLDEHDRDKKFQFFIQQYKNVDDVGTCGVTPLLVASLMGNNFAVKCLIEHGANVNFLSDKCELTALHIATIKRHLETVQILIANGADVNCRGSPQQYSALHLILCGKLTYEFGKFPEEVVKRYSNSSLSPSIHMKDAKPVRPIDCEIIKLLIKNAADVHAKDTLGRRPLHIATLRQNHRFPKMLLQAGAHPNVQDHQGNLPIIHSAKNARPLEFDDLLNFGADINDKDVSQEIMKSKDRVKIRAIKHAMKLQLLGLPVAQIYEASLKDPKLDTFREECSVELNKLKDYPIKNTSLYQFLRMDAKYQYHFVKKISKLYKSLNKIFPLYFCIIHGTCREAIHRRSLLQSARASWHQISGIYLTEVCVEKILSYLNNRYLQTFVESANIDETIVMDKAKVPVFRGWIY